MEEYMDGYTVVSWVVSGVVFWSTAFLAVRGLFPKRSYDFCNRAVSTLHAAAAVSLACLSVYDWSCPVYLSRSLSLFFLSLLFSLDRVVMEEYMDGYTVVSWVVSGVVFWSTAFLAVRGLFPKRSYDFCNRAVSTLHAAAAVSLACLSVDDWSCPVCPLAATSTPKQTKALAVTLSYMIYDAVCCHFNDSVRLDNTVHHLVSIVGIAAGLAYRKCGTEMVASMFLTEISSPLLHLREMLKEFGIKDTDLNLFVDILFAVIFSAARMVGGPYLTYVTVTADNPLLIKAMATGLQLVSAYWFLRILRMVKYKLGKKRPTKVASN